ncbi:hypothetical protein R3F64_18410 [Halomonas sp. 5021]|uniref:hypothetical protein n=1 Tax=Halomonas sp. 5021 TaxID=3082156 RepID=UPI002FC7C172
MSKLSLKVKSYLRPFAVRYTKKFLQKYAPSVLMEPRIKSCNEGSTKLFSSYSLLVHAIEVSKEPVFTLNYTLNSLDISERDIWAALNDLKGRACLNFTSIKNSVNQVESDDIRLRLIFDEVISSRDIISSSDVQALIAQYYEALDVLKSKQSIRSMLVTLILLRAPLSSVSDNLKKLSFDPAVLTESQAIKFISRIKSENDKAEFQKWEPRLNISTNAAKAKLMQIKGELFGGGHNVFERIEKEFLSLDFSISREYKNKLKPILDSIPDEDNITWIQYDNSAINDFQNLLIDKLRNKQSICYIRIGDGESYAFSDGVYVDQDGVSRQERHWWGGEICHETRQKIQSQFLSSLSHADILGIPTVTRLVKDFNLEKRDSYAINSGISRNMCVMKSMRTFLSEKKIIDCQSNLFLFDIEFCASLFKEAEKVCVVSGVNERLVKSWAPDVSKLECIEVPTHRLLRDNEVGSSVVGNLPEVYESYLERILQLASPGVVFLVSAGFIGKIFIAEASRRGAFCLDMGQTLVSVIRMQEANS